jgi:hypothetical protein
MLGSFSKEAKAEEDFSQVLDRDLSKKDIKRLNPKNFHSFLHYQKFQPYSTYTNK